MFYFKEPLMKLFNDKRLKQNEVVAKHDISQRFVTTVTRSKGVKSVDLDKMRILVEDALGGKLWQVIKEATKGAGEL